MLTEMIGVLSAAVPLPPGQLHGHVQHDLDLIKFTAMHCSQSYLPAGD